jgi:TolB-like protein
VAGSNQPELRFLLGDKDMKKYLIVPLLLGLILIGVSELPAAEDKQDSRLIFSTFDDDSAGKYAYLRDSIQTMLISRLSAKKEIQIVDQLISSKELQKLKQAGDFATLQGKQRKVDYLVTGSLFALASGLKIQVSLYPLTDSGEVESFAVVSGSEGDIFASVEQLSEQITERGLGFPAHVAADSQAAGAGSESDAFTTAHPEIAYKKGLYTGSIVGSTVGGFETKAIGVKKKVTVDGGTDRAGSW